MRVGEEVRAHCGHCGEVWHVVIALAGGAIAQVECCDCNRRHRFRSRQSKTSDTATRADRPKTGSTVEADLARPPRRYDPQARYRAGDRVKHPRFGEGVVQTLAGPTKMRVLFPGGPRLLVQARE